MLSKSPPATTVMKTAFTGGYTIRLAPHLLCPQCVRELQASDVEVIDREVVMICSGCHRSIMLVERGLQS